MEQIFTPADEPEKTLENKTKFDSNSISGNTTKSQNKTDVPDKPEEIQETKTKSDPTSTSNKSPKSENRNKELFPYKCRQCTEAFDTIANAQNHYQTVHEDKKEQKEQENTNVEDKQNEKSDAQIHKEKKVVVNIFKYLENSFFVFDPTTLWY